MLALSAVLIWGAVLQGTESATSPVVAIVNGDSIRTDRIERELMRIHMMQAEESSRREFSVERLVQKLINDRLMIQEARAIELDRDSAVTSAVRKFRENLAFRTFQVEAFPDTFTASEADIRSVFNRDYQRFEIRLLCTTDSALCVLLADSIRAGAPMDELARRHSVDKFKELGGEAGIYTLLGLPKDVRSRLLASQPGDLIGPAFLWRMHALLRVESRLEPDTTRLDSLRPVIALQVSKERREAARRDFANRMRLNYEVTVDSMRVDSLLPRMMRGERAGEEPVLRVNGIGRLSELELRNKYTHRLAGHRDREPEAVLEEVLQEQIENALLKAASAAPEFLNQTRFDHATAAFEDSVLLDRYLSEVVAAGVTVTDEEISGYYDRHRESFRGASHYRVATHTRDSLESALGDYRLLQSGTDFTWLVNRLSTDDAKQRGGVRDWMSAFEFPLDIQRCLDSVEIGGITPPFKTRMGYTIAKLLERKPGELPPLEAVKERIRAALTQQRQLEAIDRTIAILREPAEIEINERVLNELHIEGSLETLPEGGHGNPRSP